MGADRVSDAAPPPDVAEVLRDIDADVAAELGRAFDAKAQELGADMATAMWAIAQLQARVLAAAPMGSEQVFTASRFAQMVQLAFPFMALMTERSRRRAEGLPETDG